MSVITGKPVSIDHYKCLLSKQQPKSNLEPEQQQNPARAITFSFVVHYLKNEIMKIKDFSVCGG